MGIDVFVLIVSKDSFCFLRLNEKNFSNLIYKKSNIHKKSNIIYKKSNIKNFLKNLKKVRDEF
tara:strand:- start:2784 stop:2972 length:189 start_codon:yes stop_codon:yes gene_type:complete